MPWELATSYTISTKQAIQRKFESYCYQVYLLVITKCNKCYHKVQQVLQSAIEQSLIFHPSEYTALNHVALKSEASNLSLL